MIKLLLDNARQNWNVVQGLELFIGYVSNCNAIDNKITDDNLSIFGSSARATCATVLSATVTFSNAKSFGTDGGCTWTVLAWNIEWVWTIMSLDIRQVLSMQTGLLRLITGQ